MFYKLQCNKKQQTVSLRVKSSSASATVAFLNKNLFQLRWKKSVSEDDSFSRPIPSVAAGRMIDVQLIAWTNFQNKPLKCTKDSFSIRVILISCFHLVHT